MSRLKLLQQVTSEVSKTNSKEAWDKLTLLLDDFIKQDNESMKQIISFRPGGPNRYSERPSNLSHELYYEERPICH